MDAGNSEAGESRPSGPVPADSSLVLILRAQDGDEQAREELCARYLPRLRRWARGRLPMWAREHLDTEDIVQETLLHSIRQLDHFTATHDRAFWAYTCQALRNRLHDVVRRAYRRPAAGELSENHTALDPSPLELAVGSDTLKRYEGALQRLRQGDRDLIVAKVELGFQYAEITELLGKSSVGAARVAVSRALIRLAAEMGLERHGQE
jgi:RNA polymerase sigma-70 factor (ECF subfamily)